MGSFACPLSRRTPQFLLNSNWLRFVSRSLAAALVKSPEMGSFFTAYIERPQSLASKKWVRLSKSPQRRNGFVFPSPDLTYPPESIHPRPGQMGSFCIFLNPG
jgi:hypothetical protein